jgi:hypothetical protein
MVGWHSWVLLKIVTVSCLSHIFIIKSGGNSFLSGI